MIFNAATHVFYTGAIVRLECWLASLAADRINAVEGTVIIIAFNALGLSIELPLLRAS